MKLNDYKAAYNLWKLCFKEYKWDTKKRVAFFLENSPELCLVCEVGGKVVGTLLGYFDGKYVLLQHLAVHPEYRGKGIGRKLNQAADKRIAKLKPFKVISFCRKGLVKYHKNLGFEESPMVLMYKHPGGNHILWRKSN